MMHAKAVKDSRFIQKRQPISGYAMGWEKQVVWRVLVTIGANKFMSQNTYASEGSAKRAAKRMNEK